MNNKPVPLVFISHSSRDKESARWLATEFRNRGLEVWIDHERIKFGESIPKAIEEGLTQSVCIVVMLSPAFQESKWCRAEYEPLLVQEIERSGIFVIPLLIDSCDIPKLLSQKLYVDLRQPSQRSRELDVLADQIRERFVLAREVTSDDWFESTAAEAWEDTQTNKGPLLLSLERRLENDFFLSGQRKGEFGKTRIPNEAHLYHGRIRERLEHKPYYFLTYWGWEVMQSLLRNHAEEWAKLTNTALKSRFAEKRWIEVELEDYKSGPTMLFKKAVTVRHTIKAAEILLLNGESTIPSQVAWDLINNEQSWSFGDGCWKEFSDGDDPSLWSSVNAFRFLSKIVNRICPGDVPGEFESFNECAKPVIQRTEQYMETDWVGSKWKFNDLPSEVNAPLVLIDYLPFATNSRLIDSVYETLRELITPAGRLVDPDLGAKYAAPEYVLSVRLGYALKLLNWLRSRIDERIDRLAHWCLENYSDRATLDTCDIAFLTRLVEMDN
jgi:TIR domain